MNNMELNGIYIQNIKRLRLQKTYSQEALAEKAEISPGFLSDIENGKKWGSFETLIAIANALEVEPYELLLPPQTSISYDTKRTKDLMNRLRKNLGEVVDTLEDFLGEK
ncbi:MAG: helix-turn-helix transcriptional regulator [Treponema sp.]|nr:helix-turn-helix transcriptional regulator [Treponema sp.]